MSKMQLAMEDRQGSTRRDLVVEVQGYVKEFTRHSNDVLLNLNELRHRNILTDATLLVGSARLHAHCAVLIACRSVCRTHGPFASSHLPSHPSSLSHPPSSADPVFSKTPYCLKMIMSFFTLQRPFISGMFP